MANGDDLGETLGLLLGTLAGSGIQQRRARQRQQDALQLAQQPGFVPSISFDPLTGRQQITLRGVDPTQQVAQQLLALQRQSALEQAPLRAARTQFGSRTPLVRLQTGGQVGEQRFDVLTGQEFPTPQPLEVTPGRLPPGTLPFQPALRAEELRNLALQQSLLEQLLGSVLPSATPPAPTTPAAPAQPTEQRIRVRRKGTNQTGTILAKDFDPKRYQRV